MALPTFIQSGVGDADGVKGSGTLQIAFGAAIPQFDIVIVHVQTVNAPLSIGSGWTALFSNYVSANGTYVLIRVAGSGGLSATLTVGTVTSGGGGSAFGIGGTWRDGDPANPVDHAATTVFAASAASSTTMAAPQAVPTRSQSKLVGIWQAHYATSGNLSHFGTPSGMTERRRALNSNSEWPLSQSATFIYDEDLTASGGTGTRSITRSTNSLYAFAHLIALNPSPGATVLDHYYRMMRS